MLKGPSGATYRPDKVTNADGSPAILFPGTKGWSPVTLRIEEPVRRLVTDDFSLR